MDIASEGFIARVGDRSIVLDLARDKYLLLGKKLTGVALSRADANGAGRGCSEITPEHPVSRFAVIEPEEDTRPELPEGLTLTQGVPVPSETLWPTTRGGLGLGRTSHQSARALKCLYDVHRHLQRKPFQETIEYMRDEKRRSLEQSPKVGIQELLDAFHAARPWFWVAPICRLDAFALALLLWRSARDANLVFGVRLEPFAAHCWTQVGRSALNEPHPRLFQYTQIMII